MSITGVIEHMWRSEWRVKATCCFIYEMIKLRLGVDADLWHLGECQQSGEQVMAGGSVA